MMSVYQRFCLIKSGESIEVSSRDIHDWKSRLPTRISFKHWSTVAGVEKYVMDEDVFWRIMQMPDRLDLTSYLPMPRER